MTAKRGRPPVGVILGASLAGILPVVLFWIFVGRAPSLAPDEVRRVLAGPEPPVLVDVREPASYGRLHLEGAMNWPYAEIAAGASAEHKDLFRGHRLLTICNSGILSARAALSLRKTHGSEVWSVRGGLESWYAATRQPCPIAFCRLSGTDAGRAGDFPFQHMSSFEQAAATIAAFGIKPLYMALSLVLIVVLWRRPEADLSALRRAFVFFLAGESFCALNYLFFGEDSYLIEYLHIYGMVLAFGFTTYALIEGVDSRLLHLSDPGKRCAALDLCGACIKYGDAPCGAARLFMLLSGALLLLCFLPLLVRHYPESYNAMILDVVYNYSHPVVFQLFEIRYAPAAAGLGFGAALLVLVFRRSNSLTLAKILFSAGIGFLGFSMFRMVLFHAFRGNLVWYIVWEEITELLYVAGVGVVLLIFRKGLLSPKNSVDSLARRTKP